jgi:hypothetical protein
MNNDDIRFWGGYKPQASTAAFMEDCRIARREAFERDCDREVRQTICGETINLEDAPLPEPTQETVSDPVNKPAHYTGHPSGIECIQVTEHMGFNLGNALKYIWRCDLKHDAIEDLKKAEWYIRREIAKREAK